MSQQAVCVYCASSMGTHPAYENAAKCGKMGLMGTVSQAVLDNGGHVVGISPYAMVAAGGEGSKTLEGANIDK
ncbi:2469_t:CDS:2, partial [Acaulospora colombiana]